MVIQELGNQIDTNAYALNGKQANLYFTEHDTNCLQQTQKGRPRPGTNLITNIPDFRLVFTPHRLQHTACNCGNIDALTSV